MCKYCSGDVDERAYLINEDNELIYIDGNGKLTLDNAWEVQLNYCPMCGRNLKEEEPCNQ